MQLKGEMEEVDAAKLRVVALWAAAMLGWGSRPDWEGLATEW